MMRWLQTWWGRLLQALRPVVPAPAPASPPTTEAAPVVAGQTTILAEAPVERRVKVEREADPVWEFRRHLLDRLDDYMTCFRKVQRFDPSSYGLFSRIGLSIPADCFAAGPLQTESHISFGGILYSGFDVLTRERPDQIYPSVVYFQKLKHPSSVERFTGEIYRVTHVWDDRRHTRKALMVPVVCHVGVRPDGQVTVLREDARVSQDVVSTRSRRGGRKRAERLTLRHTVRRVPTWVAECSQDHHQTPDQWMGHLFRMAYQTMQRCRTNIIVRVRQHGLTGAFGIDAPRAKYFFKDREATALAADGKRKRIFHSVVAHDRAIDAVRTIQVRRHYRGIRHFGWNGYQVNIVFPDNARLLGFDRPASVLEDIPEAARATYVSETEAGKRWDAVLSQ